METRIIYDLEGNEMGSLSLPDGTSEEIWTSRLGAFTYVKPVPPIQTIQEKVSAVVSIYSEFGLVLLNRISTDNKLLGITEPQVDELVEVYWKVIQLLMLGSIPTVKAAVIAIGPFGLMTQERIDGYVAQIDEFLGL